MAAMTTRARAVRSAWRRWQWQLGTAGQALRRPNGIAFAVVLAAALAVLCAGAWRAHVRAELDRMAGEWQQSLEAVAVPDRNLRDIALRTQLDAFDAQLVGYEDSPAVLQDLIERAATLRLTLPKGSYVMTTDAEGGFVRYRMSLPIKGQADAVPRFVVDALAAHKTLALEAAQFKRDGIAATDVEARLQFVLLTQLPKAAPAMTGALR